MNLKDHGIIKVQYKRNLEGSINRIIEYRSNKDIFIDKGLIKIDDIIDKKYLKMMDIGFSEENNKIIPIGIINTSCNSCKNNIKFYLINNNVNIDDIIDSIEFAIMKSILNG